MENHKALYMYLPEKLKTEVVVEPATVLDPFVLEYANEKVDETEIDDVKKEAEGNMYEMYVRGIKGIEEQSEHSGWIIDEMTTDISLLSQVYEDFPVDEVIILTASNIDFLLERFQSYEKHPTDFQNFRNFFLSIGENDAAWRTPSTPSTDSYKEQIATDILSDILKFNLIEDEDVEEEEELNTTRKSLVQQYEESLNTYFEEIKKVQAFFENAGLKTIEIDVTNLNMENLLKEVINNLKNKYRRLATEFSDSDHAEEVQQFLTQTVEGGESEGGDKGVDDFFAKNRRYGDTYYYCPVTFFDKFVLWRGKEQYAARFKDKIYLMATEKDMKNFVHSPRKYLPETHPPMKFPPPRICVVGVTGCGKTTVSKLLAKNLGYLIEHKAIPDMIICISVSRDENVKKLLERALREWRQTMKDNRKAEEVINAMKLQEWEEKRKARYNELMEIKRANRYSKKLSQEMEENTAPTIPEEETNELGFTSDTQVSFDSVVEQQEHEETLKILDEEIPELIFEEEHIESEEEATENKRFIKHLLEEWNKTKEEFRIWCDREYQNIYKLPIDRSIWGIWDQAKEVAFAVTSERKHYYSACTTKFMHTPKNFCTLTIHFKQEIEYASLDYHDLPVLGMLEQPVIPGLSISTSALICIGLNLKVFNPRTPKKYRPLYDEALKIFQQRRSDLIKYLDLMKKFRNPAVHYEEPDSPSTDKDVDEEEDKDEELTTIERSSSKLQQPPVI
ncbi:AAA 17 domain containing protein [Asbolus verrucosus]|uniref:AAA 17 domain containing protein n=1 Tax=Asbolus verrucosus TaxID=1661398 RepID=A0A482VJH2_ASBVE|nr:AAA 17 domain containing protein [Asbolus verrucosus]